MKMKLGKIAFIATLLTQIIFANQTPIIKDFNEDSNEEFSSSRSVVLQSAAIASTVAMSGYNAYLEIEKLKMLIPSVVKGILHPIVFSGFLVEAQTNGTTAAFLDRSNIKSLRLVGGVLFKVCLNAPYLPAVVVAITSVLAAKALYDNRTKVEAMIVGKLEQTGKNLVDLIEAVDEISKKSNIELSISILKNTGALAFKCYFSQKILSKIKSKMEKKS